MFVHHALKYFMLSRIGSMNLLSIMKSLFLIHMLHLLHVLVQLNCKRWIHISESFKQEKKWNQICIGILKCEKIEMLNYLHKSPKWPKSITTFQYVVNMTQVRSLARAICWMIRWNSIIYFSESQNMKYTIINNLKFVLDFHQNILTKNNHHSEVMK